MAMVMLMFVVPAMVQVSNDAAGLRGCGIIQIGQFQGLLEFLRVGDAGMHTNSSTNAVGDEPA
jgi:hypothetical protein